MAFTLDIPDNVIDASVACCNQGNMGNRGDGSDGTKEQQIKDYDNAEEKMK